MLSTKARPPHLRSVPLISTSVGAVEQKQDLKDLIPSAFELFAPPPWTKAKQAEFFMEVAAAHKGDSEWKDIFAEQSSLRNQFINSLPQELTTLLSARDYDKLSNFLDDLFVYLEGLYAFIDKRSLERGVTSTEDYVRVQKLTNYTIRNSGALQKDFHLRRLFEPAMLPTIQAELSPFAINLIDQCTEKCRQSVPFVVHSGKEPRRGEFIHEEQIRHYLSVMHHFVTEHRRFQNQTTKQT